MCRNCTQLCGAVPAYCEGGEPPSGQRKSIPRAAGLKISGGWRWANCRTYFRALSWATGRKCAVFAPCGLFVVARAAAGQQKAAPGSLLVLGGQEQ